MFAMDYNFEEVHKAGILLLKLETGDCYFHPCVVFFMWNKEMDGKWLQET